MRHGTVQRARVMLKLGINTSSPCSTCYQEQERRQQRFDWRSRIEDGGFRFRNYRARQERETKPAKQSKNKVGKRGPWYDSAQSSGSVVRGCKEGVVARGFSMVRAAFMIGTLMRLKQP